MKQIPEGNESHKITMTFKDQHGEFLLPVSVAYKLYNVTESSLTTNSTALTPAVTIELSLAGSFVALVDSVNTKERNRVCITVVDGDSNTYTDCIEYEVIPASECACG